MYKVEYESPTHRNYHMNSLANIPLPFSLCILMYMNIIFTKMATYHTSSLLLQFLKLYFLDFFYVMMLKTVSFFIHDYYNKGLSSCTCQPSGLAGVES